MARLPPLPIEHTPELKDHFEFFYTDAERVALEFAAAAAQVPNAVTDELFARLREHWSETQIVELLGVIALFGFLNRWNDTMATPLEPVAASLGEQLLAGGGWRVGKHGG